MKRKKTVAVLVLLAGILAASACVRPGPMQERTTSVPLGDAESANIRLRMSAGEMRVHGGSPEPLLTASFRYNLRRREPVVEHHTFGKEARVTIEQRRSPGFSFGRTRNSWDLQLTDRIPLELEVSCGAGQANLDLRDVKVKRLNMRMGAGEVELDLSGDRSVSVEGSIRGGVGSGMIYLPANIGVRARIHGGLGSISAPGFTKNEHVYTNEAYGKTDVSIDLEIHAGIGSIDLKLR